MGAIEYLDFAFGGRMRVDRYHIVWVTKYASFEIRVGPPKVLAHSYPLTER